MRITHYLYNSFVIEAGDTVLGIDPGAAFRRRLRKRQAP